MSRRLANPGEETSEKSKKHRAKPIARNGWGFDSEGIDANVSSLTNSSSSLKRYEAFALNAAQPVAAVTRGGDGVACIIVNSGHQFPEARVIFSCQYGS